MPAQMLVQAAAEPISDLAFFSFLCIEILWDQQGSHREWYNMLQSKQIGSKKSSLESMS
tara:strand:+ start:1608 stop:1784 length:177 start_codon:yes stop_codon:yes gene_type:complete